MIVDNTESMFDDDVLLDAAEKVLRSYPGIPQLTILLSINPALHSELTIR